MKLATQIYCLIFFLVIAIGLTFVVPRPQPTSLDATGQTYEIDNVTVPFHQGSYGMKISFDQDGLLRYPDEASEAARYAKTAPAFDLTYRVIRVEKIPLTTSMAGFTDMVLIDKTFDQISSWLFLTVFDAKAHLGYVVLKLGRYDPGSQPSLQFHPDKTVTVSYSNDQHQPVKKQVFVPDNGMVQIYE